MLYKYKCKVARWIDGDTVDLFIDLGFNLIFKQRIRLARVDTPEKGQEGYARSLGYCMQLFPVGSEVILESSKGDKYGRWIGEISNLEGLNISTELLKSNNAKIYE